jgi:uracil-DNA glycosylase family 4
MFVPPEINHPEPGHVLLVGRDPGEDEEREGRPFIGRAGELLDSVLASTGLRRRDCNIANVVGWRPPANDFKAHEFGRVLEGVDQLRQLRTRLRPSLTITLGNEAAYACIPDWPSAGRGILGAKGIEDRRGYFWDTPDGLVLSTLHPAGVLRKQVPGRYLLGMDFRRARRWLAGDLPRDAFPLPIRLTHQGQVEKILHSKLVAWDIETKWDMTALLCSGFCGDDMQPYVAMWGHYFDLYGKQILLSDVPKVGHNGVGFDVPAMRRFYDLHVQHYHHDTQQLWWALEPDLAGSSDTDEEDKAITANRMTRKGLSFLASLYFNLPWWKNYPPPEDPQHDEKMFVLNGRDAYVTRWLAACMLPEMEAAGCKQQYDLATALYPALVEMQLKGVRVNVELQQHRLSTLQARAEVAKEISAGEGLRYIQREGVAAFARQKRCDCCGGGAVSRQACWRCAGYAKKPGKKIGATLCPCVRCGGAGKLTTYQFNPYSPAQMKTFLYEAIGAPKNVWNNKITSDATALKKVLRWARNQ